MHDAVDNLKLMILANGSVENWIQHTWKGINASEICYVMSYHQSKHNWTFVSKPFVANG